MAESAKPKPLRKGSLVTIKNFQYTGYQGRIQDHDGDRFYWVRITHDPYSKKLTEPLTHGMYCAAELKLRQKR